MAYVGALYTQSGYNVVQNWVNQLLEPSDKRVKNEPTPSSIPLPLPPVSAPADVSAASQARFVNQFKPNTPTFSQPSPRQQPPPYLPGTGGIFSNSDGLFKSGSSSIQSQPPPPSSKPPPLPPAPNTQVSFLPLFNQVASQRRLGVEYTAQFFGPPHAGKWHVKCLGVFLLTVILVLSGAGLCKLTNTVDFTVNSVEKGQGTGPSKQIAKEEAAKMAYYAMGWSS